MTITNNQTGEVTKRFYSNGYEKEILSNNTVRELNYISSPYGLIAVYIQKAGASDKFYYIQTDRQGSIVGLTDIENGIIETTRYSYDAWGRMRNPDNWSYSNVPFLSIITRGYTGHEHLEMFALINMNGRLYDPAVGRFLSPDNYIQLADFPQSYNRYSYCLNNPLKFSDPDGQWFGWDDAIVAGISFGIGYLNSAITTGDWGWKSVKAGLQGAVMGWLSYNPMGLSGGWLPGGAAGPVSSTFANVLPFAENLAINTALNDVLPNVSLPISKFGSLNFSTSLCVGNVPGIGGAGIIGDFDCSLTLGGKDANITFGTGLMTGRGYCGVSFSSGWCSASFFVSNFKGQYEQTTWLAKLSYEIGFLATENDSYPWFEGNGQDKYRTASLVGGYDKFEAGWQIFTTKPGIRADDPSKEEDEANILNVSKSGSMWGPNLRGYYPNGTALNSPFYVRYDNYRFGIDAPFVQDFFQNGWHKNVVDAPSFSVAKYPPIFYFQYGGQRPYTYYSY